jgi:ribose transport system permease protein
METTVGRVLSFLMSVVTAAITALTAFWDFLSFGTVLGVPFNYFAALATAIVLHILLTRIRLGWHIRAIGGSRRSAHQTRRHRTERYRRRR